MNTVNTTLRILYNDIQSNEQHNVGTIAESQTPIMYIINSTPQTNKFEAYNGLEDFLNIYHTLGNFIPVPIGCNAPRGLGPLKDYWDLTLACIYNWYASNEEDKIKNNNAKEYHIAMVLNKQPTLKDYEAKQANYKSWGDYIYKTTKEKTPLNYEIWLESYKTWNNFVKENYMQDFVTIINEERDEYGKPKQLWENHFKENVKPNTKRENNKKSQCEQFFENATNSILERGKRMLNKLIFSLEKAEENEAN